MTPAESAGSCDFDLLVYGGTAPGIVAAVRAAREGLNVALVTNTPYLGGSFPSLGAIETHYRGNRCPLLQELIDRITAHYRKAPRGDGFQVCTSGAMITFEPNVAEGILRQWIGDEVRITWFSNCALRSVDRRGELLNAATFVVETTEVVTLSARVFIEASDEGDFMAAAGVQFRIGREGREDFDEPSAGKIFTRWQIGRFPRAAISGELNLVTANATTSAPLPGSTGMGDENIQSYSYRLCLTDFPENRILLEQAPMNYVRERYAPLLLSLAEKERLRLPFHHRFLIYSLEEMAANDHIFHGHALPNRKRSWNAANFTGAAKDYPLAGALQRRAIERAHLEHALGLMWFLQRDPEVPAAVRRLAAPWGLARDEFTSTGNLPPHIYVREARRMVGRSVFCERDALVAPGSKRAPIHADSVAITEFSLDSLACTTERLPGAGGLCDGQLFQMEVSRPGQVPYGSMLSPAVDNLLVVTTLSATHVGWGTLRQTPTLMHLAESAARAVVLADQRGISPACLDIRTLQRDLVEHGISITFFNDCDMSTKASWVPGVQFFGAHGFFPSYDARPHERLSRETELQWLEALRLNLAPSKVVTDILNADAAEANQRGHPTTEISRGDTCAEIYRALGFFPADRETDSIVRSPARSDC